MSGDGASPVRLIAGGATGIGRACALAFLAQGDDVLLADIDAPRGEALAAENRGPGRLAFVQADLTDPDAPEHAVAAAMEAFGRLDTVFANAGVLHVAPLAEWRMADWQRSLALNLTAPFFLSRAAAPALAQGGGGSIILTSSTAALRGHASLHAYHATKAGLVGLTRSLAAELAPAGTRVNAILPGFVDTPFNEPFWRTRDDRDATTAALVSRIPLGRQAVPDDVVGTVLHLSSDAAAYVTGTQAIVDGGYSIT